MDESLIINVWETFKDYIPEKSREAAADQFVELLVGMEIDMDIFESLLGFDADLDKAIEVVLENREDDLEDDEDLDEWDDGQLDEDY